MRSPTPRSRRRFRLTALATAALLAAGGAAATGASAALQEPGADAPAASTVQPDTAHTLNITMQAQQKSNWCWAGSGDTIAAWFGRNYSQNQFCDAAFGYRQGTVCPNNQATLGNVQNALSWAGIAPGRYVTGYLAFDTIRGEIDGRRPMETRIQWRSGGGHMHVVYGYDGTAANGGTVYYGDPWPSDNRYNWADYGWYTGYGNNSFSWTHSLYRIGA